MNDQTQDIIVGLPVIKPITADLARAEINLALTKASLSFQVLQDKIDAIVPNEDGIQAMADVINEEKRMEKKIEETFEIGKKPYWDGGKAWDAAKSDLLALGEAAISKTRVKYNELCKAIEKRKKDAKDKAEKDKATIEGINTNILAFSAQITACKTNKELVGVEARINLEKSRTTKYGEFMPVLLEKLLELNELVKTQKATVQALEALQLKKAEAEKEGDDGKLLDLIDQEEILTATVHQNKVDIETKVVNSTTSYSGGGGGYARESFPVIKGGRRQWKMKIVDQDKAYKNGMLSVEINSAKAKLEMANLREANKDATEFFKDGLHYYEEKIF